jgi:adenylylsulfate reductase subunit B
MSIQISENKCIGCGRCVEACPGNLIKKNKQGKAAIRHIRDCWGCTSCLKECPVQAISFFLGADIGGKGGRFTVKSSDEVMLWSFEDGRGQIKTIEVHKKDSNKY